MSSQTGGADPKSKAQSATSETASRQLKQQLSKQTATLLSSASSPSIASTLLKKDEKKMDAAPKGMTNSSSATSIVSSWILAPFERLNHTTADFEVYAGTPPDDSSESPHYFGGGGYNHDLQENKKLRAQLGDGPKSEIISKLMPHVVVSSVAPQQQQQQSTPSLSVKPSFDSLSQFFDSSSNEPSPNVSPMPSPRSSPFLGRRLINPDGTIKAPGGLASMEISPLAYRDKSAEPDVNAASGDKKMTMASISKYSINTGNSMLTSTACVGSNDKKSKSPQTFKFNVGNFDLNAVGPSSW